MAAGKSTVFRPLTPEPYRAIPRVSPGNALPPLARGAVERSDTMIGYVNLASSIFSTVANNTFAPFTISVGCENSFGE